MAFAASCTTTTSVLPHRCIDSQARRCEDEGCPQRHRGGTPSHRHGGSRCGHFHSGGVWLVADARRCSSVPRPRRRRRHPRRQRGRVPDAGRGGPRRAHPSLGRLRARALAGGRARPRRRGSARSRSSGTSSSVGSPSPASTNRSWPWRPMAVVPEHQRQGIGSALVRAGLDAAESLEEPLVVVLGHPWFYPRFGFKRASRYGLFPSEAWPDAAFMAKPLTRWSQRPPRPRRLPADLRGRVGLTIGGHARIRTCPAGAASARNEAVGAVTGSRVTRRGEPPGDRRTERRAPHDRAMDDRRVGTLLRELRRRKRWRQADLAAHARASVSSLSLTLSRVPSSGWTSCEHVAWQQHSARRWRSQLRWRGPDADRLLDLEHARLVEAVALAAPCSRVGRRCRVDLQPLRRAGLDRPRRHGIPARPTLLVVEVKTRVVDIQALLSSVDRKVRLAPTLLAAERGWRATSVGRMLALPSGSTSRDAFARHSVSLGAAFPARNVAIRRWLVEPRGPLGRRPLRPRYRPRRCCGRPAAPLPHACPPLTLATGPRGARIGRSTPPSAVSWTKRTRSTAQRGRPDDPRW